MTAIRGCVDHSITVDVGETLTRLIRSMSALTFACIMPVSALCIFDEKKVFRNKFLSTFVELISEKVEFAWLLYHT